MKLLNRTVLSALVLGFGSTLIVSCGSQDVGEESSPLAVVGPFISKSQVKSYIAAAGFPADKVNVAAAVSQCESSLGTKSFAIGQGRRHTGLFQISDLHKGACGYGGKSLDGFRSAMNAPGANAKCAFVVYKNAGSNFSPWDCYRFGSYRKFL